MDFAKFRIVMILAGGLWIASVAAASAGEASTPDQAAYCVEKGGVVQTRIPEYGTNGGNPLILSGQKDFCQFTSAKDGSQINVLLHTLATRQPTLAALAYYAEVAMGSCSGNPASCYCTLLGGSDLFGGIDAAGGGWVLSTDPTDVLEACIFPDMSSIDSWGLAYHSVGIVRGKNLAHALRYKDPYGPSHGGEARKIGLPF